MKFTSVFGWLATAALLAPGQARAQAPAVPSPATDGAWHFTVAPYLWMTGIDGDVSVPGQPPIPVHTAFSDLWEDLDFGFSARFEGRKDRFGLGADVTYNDLGVPVAADAPVPDALGLKTDVRQLFAEGYAFYRLARGTRENSPAHVDLIVGARYTGTRSRLTADDGDTRGVGDAQTLDWLDALAGFKARMPLGARVALLGRADVAGFGSSLTWNLEGDLVLEASERWAFGAGWRHMDIEYDNGESGAAYREFDIAYDGPRVWFAYRW